MRTLTYTTITATWDFLKAMAETALYFTGAAAFVLLVCSSTSKANTLEFSGNDLGQLLAAANFCHYDVDRARLLAFISVWIPDPDERFDFIQEVIAEEQKWMAQGETFASAVLALMSMDDEVGNACDYIGNVMGEVGLLK